MYGVKYVQYVTTLIDFTVLVSTNKGTFSVAHRGQTKKIAHIVARSLLNLLQRHFIRLN